MYGFGAVGLVVVHRTSRYLDLSQGAAATAAAFTAHRLRAAGIPLAAAVAAGLVVAALVGCVSGWFLRRIGAGRPLAALAGTLAVGGIVVAACTGLFGTQPQFAAALLTTPGVRLAGTVVSAQQLLVLGVAALLVGTGTMVLRRTWAGLAWTGLAGDRQGALVCGLPATRLELASTVTGAVLAGIAGILVAPLLFLDVGQLTVFFLVKPFAAAAASGLVSLSGALAAGIAIGVIESLLVPVQFVPGLGEAVPFAVVVVALALACRRRGPRAVREAPLPPLTSGPSVRPGRGATWPAVLLVTALVAAAPHVGPYWATIFGLGAVTAVLAAAHVVLTGWTGQLSLAGPAFTGIGAVVAARSATGAGLPFPLAILTGAAAGAVAAGAVSAVALRRATGAVFAAITLAFAASCSGVLLPWPTFAGTAASRTLPVPRIGTVSLGGGRYATVAVVIAAGAFLILWWLGRSRLGDAMVAVREHEKAAVALGIPAGWIRCVAFVVTGGLGGLGGAVLAFQLQAVAVEQFHALAALPVLSVAVVGGIESLWGAAVGAALLTVGPELLRHLSADTLAAALPPTSLLLVLALRPAGLCSVGSARAVARHRDRRKARARRSKRHPVAGRRPPDRLVVEGLEVLVGQGFKAVDRMDLVVDPGETVALIGPNGSGKTTLFDAISGFVSPAGGRIILGDRTLRRHAPSRRAALGLVRTFQSGGLFPRLSICDNIDIPRRWHRVDPRAVADLAAAAGLDAAPDQPAHALPPGTARTAEIIRALVLDPAVLLLDEPTAGLSRSETAALMALLRQSAARAAVIVIEHDLRVVAEADRVYVMDAGRLLATGDPDAVRRDPKVVAAYLGTADDRHGPPAAKAPAERGRSANP